MASDRQALARRIEELYGELERLVGGLRPDQLYWEPGGEAWTVMQVLAHVGEFPGFFAGELLRAVADPGTRWGRTMADAARLQAVADGRGSTLQEAWERVQRGRQAILDALGSISDGDLDVEAEHVNPKFGRRSMRWLVEHFIIEHLEGHIGQIRRNLQQQAAESAGRG
jgi:uncharacterized damage-inducible protein DinB